MLNIKELEQAVNKLGQSLYIMDYPPRLTLEPQNCRNCAAPHNGIKCEYCGSYHQ